MPRRLLSCVSIFAYALAAGLAAPLPAPAQEEEAGAAETEVEQLITDAEALIIGVQTTMRCALYDTGLQYLTPLEETAARIRLEQYQSALDPQVDDLPDRLAGIRAEANVVACGESGLAPYLEFSRQVALDVIDIGLVAISEIEIARCSYFADDAFMASVVRAREAAASLTLEGDPARIAYIEEMAAGWVSVFAQNCTNLSFDPTDTLPGRIALAIPRED